MNANSSPTPPGENEVSAYLANRLTEVEAQAFEQYCLEHPNFARDVERELQLKVGIRRLHHPASLATKMYAKKRSYWPIALAASMILAALVFFELRPHSAPPALLAVRSLADLPSGLRHAPISSADLIQLRGDLSNDSITTTQESIIELRFLADSASKASDYSLRMVPDHATPASSFVIDRLRAGQDGYLRVYFPAKQVIGNTWLLTLMPTGAPPGSKDEQVFRVQFKAPNTPSG
jgi:hypothetical protein